MSLFYTLVLSLLTFTLAQTPDRTLQGPVSVTRVIDGDTIVVDLFPPDDMVRLVGIDTPETKHPTKGVELFGPEASAFTASLLEGKQVWLKPGVEERDRYGRLLAYVYFEDPQGR